MKRSQRLSGLKGFLLLCGLWMAVPVCAQTPLPNAVPASPVASIADMRCLNPCQLEQVYAGAAPGAQPVGFVRGEFLYMADKKHPRLAKRLTGAVWKGKHFHEDGSFINQWAGFRAIESRVQIGESRFDGRPCLILEYTDKTPVLANVRDEVREVAPGVYLAMVYERHSPHKFLGFIGMELSPSR